MASAASRGLCRRGLCRAGGELSQLHFALARIRRCSQVEMEGVGASAACMSPATGTMSRMKRKAANDLSTTGMAGSGGGADAGTSGGAGVSPAAATGKVGSVKTRKRAARRSRDRHRRRVAKAGGAAEAADDEGAVPVNEANDGGAAEAADVGGAADVDEANDGGAAEAAGVGGAADEDAFPTQVDESNICQLIAQALVLKFQYLLANEGMLFKTCDGNSITVGQLINLGMKALEDGLYGEAIRITQLVLVLRQSCVFQPVFGDALLDPTKDGAGIAVKVLRENAGRVAVKPFLVPILYTVNVERNGAGVNRLAGILKVTHVSLLQNAEVHPLRDAWHQCLRPVYSMPFLTWILQDRCPELPDTPGLTWVTCYRNKIEEDYRAKCINARAERRRSPSKPEQRVVLEGKFAKSPQDRDLVVLPCQMHMNGGPYDMPGDWALECFKLFLSDEARQPRGR